MINSLNQINFFTDSSVFIVGGVDNDCFKKSTASFQKCILKTTEYISIGSSGVLYYETGGLAKYGPNRDLAKYGPNLPFGIFDHCMVKLPCGTIYMIGGIRSDLNSTESLKRQTVSILTLQDDGDTLRLRSGPSIAENDILLCGTYENDAGVTNIIVFSKKYNDPLCSV